MLHLAAAPLVPKLVGEPWIVAGNPYLGDLTGEKQQPVDFAIWPARDGTWQLWSCIRNTKEPGITRLFYRWAGASLMEPHWQPGGIAMHADPQFGETPGGLQAPHVVPHADGHLMFYGDWEHICIATSEDGKAFTRRPNAGGGTAMFSEGRGWNTRDPMALRIAGVWHCYYTAFPERQGAVFCRTSADTVTWNEARRVAFGGEAGTNAYSAECPFVVEPLPGEFYLFRTQRYGRDAISRVYYSGDPLDFGVNDDSHLVTSLPVAAPEIIRHNGEWYIAFLRSALDGIKVSQLEWAAGGASEGTVRSEPGDTVSKPADAANQTPGRQAVRSFAPQASVNFREPSREYVVTNAQGWIVKLERELAEAHPELARAACARLDAKLAELLSRLPANSHALLRRLPIYLMLGEEAAAGGRDNGAEYFQRRAPAHFPHMDPGWGSSLVIYSARNYIQLSDEWAIRVLVHEFAHAWQLEQWPEDQPEILEAFRHATARGLYRDVKDVNGDVVETAYAAQNQLEYFSELTCAYFLRGEYVPLDRDALRPYDPEGSGMIERLWGVGDAPPQAGR